MNPPPTQAHSSRSEIWTKAFSVASKNRTLPENSVSEHKSENHFSVLALIFDEPAQETPTLGTINKIVVFVLPP